MSGAELNAIDARNLAFPDALSGDTIIHFGTPPGLPLELIEDTGDFTIQGMPVGPGLLKPDVGTTMKRARSNSAGTCRRTGLPCTLVLVVTAYKSQGGPVTDLLQEIRLKLTASTGFLHGRGYLVSGRVFECTR